MIRRSFAILALAAWGCEPDVIEMDAAFHSQKALCADVDCSEPPRCSDGGSSCLACLCCACSAGETRCDPQHSSVRWQCQGGCFVDAPCPTAYETCEMDRGTATCVLGAVDCERIHPYDLIAICGETETLCAECGCMDCSDMGAGAVFCDDFRPSSDGNSVLECATSSGCMERLSCNDGAHCLQGIEMPVAGCSDEITCAEVGCTGMPVCGESAEVCGDCGCCRVDAGYPDMCGLATAGDGHSRFVLDSTELCYDEVPCATSEFCAYDINDQPFCYTD